MLNQSLTQVSRAESVCFAQKRSILLNPLPLKAQFCGYETCEKVQPTVYVSKNRNHGLQHFACFVTTSATFYPMERNLPMQPFNVESHNCELRTAN